MRNILIYLLPLIAILWNCNGDNGKSKAYGNFEAKEIIVSSEANGQLINFDVEEGSKISKGVIVGRVDTAVLTIQHEQLLVQKDLVRSKIAQINAQKEVYETQLENIVTEKNRVEKLFKDGAATDKQMDDVTGQYNLVKKQLDQLDTQNQTVLNEIKNVDKQISLIKLQLEKCKIKNPIDGLVLEKYVEENELVNQGKSLYKIAPADVIYLRAYVSEPQLTTFSLGDSVKVYCDVKDGESKEFDGSISWISSTAEFTPKIVQTSEERVNLVYAIKVALKNDGSLKIGMPGEVVLSN